MALVMKLVGGPEGTAEKCTQKQQYTPAEHGHLSLIFCGLSTKYEL